MEQIFFNRLQQKRKVFHDEAATFSRLVKIRSA